MKKILYWIPVLGIAFPSCQPSSFKHPEIYGWYQIIMCLLGLSLLQIF